MGERILSEKEKKEMLKRMAIDAKLHPFTTRTWGKIIDKRRRTDGSIPEVELHLSVDEIEQLQDARRADRILRTVIVVLTSQTIIVLAYYILQSI